MFNINTASHRHGAMSRREPEEKTRIQTFTAKNGEISISRIDDCCHQRRQLVNTI